MLTPSLAGWKVNCVGDDIAWLKFDKNGVLRAINPEKGFFGVCPGTSMASNSVALKTIQYNTIFTNVAHTGKFTKVQLYFLLERKVKITPYTKHN